jgi:iron complex outermembrane receptor protein
MALPSSKTNEKLIGDKMKRPAFKQKELAVVIAALCMMEACASAAAQTAEPAQQAESPVANAEVATLPPKVTSTTASAARGEIATVVVTATRRSERLQDVPLAITAVRAADLQTTGVKDLSSLAQVLPGLDYSEGNNTPGFRVRGIGSLVSGQYFSNAELPVGVVVDGVVQGLGPSLSNMGEVERVEVLKGPQGTQFGKNSAAGVINITTIRPVLGEKSGDVYASYGNLKQYEARGALNLPLGEIAAMRVSAFKSGYDGYINNVPSNTKIGGDRQKGAAIKVLIKPANMLDIFLSADYSDEAITGGSNTRQTINSLAGTGFTAPAGITPGFSNLDNADQPYLIGEQTTRRSGVSMEVNYRVEDYTLTSVTAYRKRKTSDWGGGGGGLDTLGPDLAPFGSLLTSYSRSDKTQSTQEFRVTSPKSDFLQYVAGYVFYRQPTLSREAGGYILPTPVAGHTWLVNPQHGLSRVDTAVKSNALFFDGKLKLDTKNAILMGLRYTRDNVTAAFSNPVFDDSPLGAAYTTGGAVNPPFFGAPVSAPASSTDVSASKLTYKIGAEHKVSNDLMLFATYSTGYLGPVINYKFDGTPDILKPQTNANITIGVKSQSLDKRLTLNANLFNDKYKNFQTGFFNGATLQFVGENAATGTTRGVEVEASYRLAPSSTVGVNAAYIDATFGDYCSSLAQGFPNIADCTTPSGAAGGQISGYAINGVPKKTVSLFTSHTMSIVDGYRLKLGANYYYRSAIRARPADPKTETPGYGLLGLNATWSPDSHAWSLNLYVRNALDKHYPQADISGAGPYPVNYPTRETLRAVGISGDASF